MKKILLITLLFIMGLFGNSDYELRFSNLNYVFNYKIKNCEKVPYDMKVYFMELHRNQNLFVDKKITSVTGILTNTFGMIEGKELKFDFMTNYQTCKLFEDIYILKKDVKDTKAYINLKEPK